MRTTANTPVPVSVTDLRKVISYLDDAAKLYEALGRVPMQKCVCRAAMINQLINKLKTKLP